MPTDQELKDAVRSERMRCLKVLKDEINRGRSLLGLLDTAGKPVFDDRLTQACIEALTYCGDVIAKLPDQR